MNADANITTLRRRLRVLFVEDSETDALLLLRALQRGGFEPGFDMRGCVARQRSERDGQWQTQRIESGEEIARRCETAHIRRRVEIAQLIATRQREITQLNALFRTRRRRQKTPAPGIDANGQRQRDAMIERVLHRTAEPTVQTELEHRRVAHATQSRAADR